MKIHKYMKIEHAIDALEHGIYAGTLDSFNDPYEYEGILYPDLYRVCCLTGSDRKCFYGLIMRIIRSVVLDLM